MVENFLFKVRDGQTPLPMELRKGLIPKNIQTMGELETFVPDTYDPCPCASGKKFKFCCKPIFKNITFAMCAAQDSQLEEALKHMDEAKLKVGETSEVLCRYGICWSFFDMNKADESY